MTPFVQYDANYADKFWLLENVPEHNLRIGEEEYNRQLQACIAARKEIINSKLLPIHRHGNYWLFDESHVTIVHRDMFPLPDNLEFESDRIMRQAKGGGMEHMDRVFLKFKEPQEFDRFLLCGPAKNKQSRFEKRLAVKLQQIKEGGHKAVLKRDVVQFDIGKFWLLENMPPDRRGKGIPGAKKWAQEAEQERQSIAARKEIINPELAYQKINGKWTCFDVDEDRKAFHREMKNGDMFPFPGTLEFQELLNEFGPRTIYLKPKTKEETQDELLFDFLDTCNRYGGEKLHKILKSKFILKRTD